MSNVPFGHSCCMRCGEKDCDIKAGEECFITDVQKREEKDCKHREDSNCSCFKLTKYSIEQLIERIKGE